MSDVQDDENLADLLEQNAVPKPEDRESPIVQEIDKIRESIGEAAKLDRIKEISDKYVRPKTYLVEPFEFEHPDWHDHPDISEEERLAKIEDSKVEVSNPESLKALNMLRKTLAEGKEVLDEELLLFLALINQNGDYFDPTHHVENYKLQRPKLWSSALFTPENQKQIIEILKGLETKATGPEGRYQIQIVLDLVKLMTLYATEAQAHDMDYEITALIKFFEGQAKNSINYFVKLKYRQILTRAKEIEKRGRTFYHPTQYHGSGTEKISKEYWGEWRNDKLVDLINDRTDMYVASDEEFIKLMFPDKKFDYSSKEAFLSITSLDFRKGIEEDFGINLADFELWEQRLLMQYLIDIQVNDIPKIKEFLNGGDRNRLLALTSAGDDREFDEVLFKLALDPNSDAIFKQYANLVELVNKQYDELRYSSFFDRATYSGIVLKRAKELLKKGQLILGDKSFQEDVVATGALFRAVANDEDNKKTDPALINEMLSQIHVDKFNGGLLVKKTDRHSMQDPNNYTHPELFSAVNYKTFVENVRETYKGVDEKWAEYIIDHFPDDLTNPDATYVVVKNNDGGLLGMCKIRKIKGRPNTYYIGNLHVDTEYQRDFKIGEYVEEVAREAAGENAKFVATVAVSNSVVERHVELRDVILTEIKFEDGDPKNSKEIFGLELNYDGKYATKSFDRKRIKAIAEGEVTDIGAEADFKCIKADTSPQNNAEFIKTAKAMFAKGYVITRFFYEKGDLSETYVVFEKRAQEAIAA